MNTFFPLTYQLFFSSAVDGGFGVRESAISWIKQFIQ